MGEASEQSAEGFLHGVRVLEVADELGEYCGKFLAGIGADVVKVEPPQGEVTRSYGPFYNDTPDRERSLYFWHYNFGKRSVTLDLDSDEGQARFRDLATDADVVIDTRPAGYMDARGVGYEALKTRNAGLIYARITPFGETGPWKDWKGSDLVHLALGGVMNNCGYDADPSGFYETPPIAPQMWQSYHVAGEMTAMGVLSALYHRARGGPGQMVSTPVHWAVAQATERDVPSWVFLRQTHRRATCRHSSPLDTAPVLAPTKDGRWMFPYRSYAHAGDELKNTIAILAKYGMEEDLLHTKYADPAYVAQKGVSTHVGDVVQRFVQRFMFDREIWREFQDAGLTWAPVRRPEENIDDAHWRARDTFFEVEHPEIGRTLTEVGARWMCPQVAWRHGPKAPSLGEHNEEVLGAPRAKVFAKAGRSPQREAGPRGGALDGVKFLDLGWLVASAGAGRFLAAQGADVVKVEHKSRWDGMRNTTTIVPEGLRAERDAATAPLRDIKPGSPNRSGFFMDINAGKRAIGLNLKKPEGKALLTQLIEAADVIAEGYSPGTMDRMGFGYDRLKELNRDIVYVQQSGMGQIGLYGGMRSYGPVAQAFSGISELSGLPEPFPPAGIGYSYLDWFGAWNLCNAILAGLYRREKTGEGCWIDACQVEVGTYLCGTALLDYSANGRAWARSGNCSPYKPAAPHGAYRVAGADRWVAIACFTEAEWRRLLGVLENPAWGADARFATLADRMANQHDLDKALNAAVGAREPYALMQALQAAGVPAGVCQTAEDRCDRDPQLKSDGWLVDLRQSEIGVWPSKQMPVRFSETIAHVGGAEGRHGPSYAEDNERVYGEWLGLSVARIRELEENGVI